MWRWLMVMAILLLLPSAGHNAMMNNESGDDEDDDDDAVRMATHWQSVVVHRAQQEIPHQNKKQDHHHRHQRKIIIGVVALVRWTVFVTRICCRPVAAVTRYSTVIIIVITIIMIRPTNMAVFALNLGEFASISSQGSRRITNFLRNLKQKRHLLIEIVLLYKMK